jgi:hypothetical protein
MEAAITSADGAIQGGNFSTSIARPISSTISSLAATSGMSE